MAAGAHLGGGKAVLLMQSSGTGNCINMLSLIKHGRFPFLTFVTMRGDFGEENPWQIAMGQAVRPALESIGVICLPVERPDEVLMTARAAMGMAYKSQCGVAVLLSQKLLGAKGF
jgi:sulfopyruvate decarboxylase TPP-binding subunit